jgi:hypothetical protein
MEGGIFSGNEAVEGGAVYNFKESVFTMSGDAVISGNKGIYGGAVYNSGTLSLESGAKILNNFAQYVNPPGGGYGGAVYNICSFSMQEGTEISGNKADSFGGGVYSHGSTYVNGAKRIAIFTMTGGKICNNESGATGGGGGVALISDSTFNLSGGEISGNKGGIEGGGVHNYYSTFDMSGDAVISDNQVASTDKYSSYGGGLYNYHSTFTMAGGKISGNTSTAYGGGVCNLYTSKFEMSGGEISDNTTMRYGGGVFNYYDSAFNMIGGEISDNTVTYYGGGVANFSGTFTMKGGTITGNTADTYGGGVYNYLNSTFSMSDDAVISSNTAYCGGGIFNTGPLSITGGSIIYNTAEGADIEGSSGGGIYAVYFDDLTVADGVVFSGNVAPTLRTTDIADDADFDVNGTFDLKDYAMIGEVTLDATVNVGQNAPAYNNYDINYPGDSYAVYVDIEADGTGTVTVTDTDDSTVYWTLTSDGWIYVSTTVSSITLSAVPESEYEFKQFIIDDGSKSSDNPTVVPISGNMSVIAKFESAETPPEANKTYYIKATADGGSTITPEGEVSVPAGKDEAFTFSAKHGYRITAVYVDGIEMPSEKLASGEYTFFDVKMDHTISVTSIPGDGPIGGDGDNSGEEDDKGDGSGDWAVLNLICAILAVFTGIIAVIAGRDRFRKDNEEKRSKTAMMFRVLALMIGLISIIIFFLTEDWNLPVTPMDEWTLLMFILFLATLVLTMVSFRYDRAPEGDEEDLTERRTSGNN